MDNRGVIKDTMLFAHTGHECQPNWSLVSRTRQKMSVGLRLCTFEAPKLYDRINLSNAYYVCVPIVVMYV